MAATYINLIRSSTVPTIQKIQYPENQLQLILA